MGGGIGGGGFGYTAGGRANSIIHKGRQDKHIEGTNNYKQQKANGKNPSILKEDAEKLLREGAGKGVSPRQNKERVDFGRVIGKYYHEDTGKYYDTSIGMIHYDSKGNAHLVPAKPKDFKD